MARGDTWSVASSTRHTDCEVIRLTGASSSNAGKWRTLLVPFDRVTSLQSAVRPVVVGRRRWAREVLRAAATCRPFGSLASTAAANIELLPFQLEPALAMLRHGATRVLIADDVGLGKTIQAGVILAELSNHSDEFRAIVLTPAGLRDQWQRELLERFALRAVVADAGWVAASGRELPPDVNPWSLPGIHIASSDLVKRPEVLRSLEEVTWDIAVVDEAHGCTLSTARLAGAAAISERSRRVLLLTATPPDGDPPQLLAIRSIGALTNDEPVVAFRRSREHLDGLTPRHSAMLQVRLSAAERRMHRLLDQYTSLVWREAGARADHRARLAAAVLRKRALSSAWSLATSVRRRIELLGQPPIDPDAPTQLFLPLVDDDEVNDETPEAVIGAIGLCDTKRELDLLADVERAARHAARHESKLRFLLRFLRRAREPAIVFTEYRDTLLHLEGALAAAGQPAVLMHGGMAPRERLESQRTFDEGGVVLLATDAASEGLNLHRSCRTIVHFELPWTLARLRQRTGRVDRLGQKRTVHEILLVARHTAERLVLAPLVRRAHLARRGTGHFDRTLSTLTESSIATAVMEGAEIAVPEVPSAEHQPMPGLRAESREEADRIAGERRSLGNAPLGPAVRQILVQPSKRFRNVTVCIAARLEDGAGRVVHASLVPLRIDWQLRVAPVRHAQWRALATALDATHRKALQSAARLAAAEALQTAAARHAYVIASLRRRDAAILQARPSAARRLVQAGLFDARAVRASERQRQTATLLAEAADNRTRGLEDASRLREVLLLIGLR